MTVAAMATTIILYGCGSHETLDPPITGYSCCNLFLESGSSDNFNWISRDNPLGGSHIVAAGESVKIHSFNWGYHMHGTLGREDATFAYDLPWARMFVVADDPKRELAAWSSETQAAVRAGKVIKGMTRRQVLMSLGYPPSKTPDPIAPGPSVWRYYWARALISLSFSPPPIKSNPIDLDAKVWRYYWAKDATERATGQSTTVDVHFGPDGKVASLTGSPTAVQSVEFRM
jgi:hypothetical protein